MRRRWKQCGILFVCTMIIVVLSGILFPEELAQTTGNQVIAERTVIPGGQSVGIQMNVKGALIVGIERNVGPEVGDMIVEVNDQPVDSPEDVSNAIGAKGEQLEITVVRNKKRMQFNINPYYDHGSGEYKLGFWIKEKIAGIGTLTYYDPESGSFGALGHGIYEPETGKLLENETGKLLHTAVNQIKEGKAGEPGELGGVIYNFDHPFGSLSCNTDFGVYGTISAKETFDGIEPMAVGSASSVKEGEACILSTINGIEVKSYDIEITKIHHMLSDSARGIELKVTDKELLKSCGGIVQGMSGSPVIQNGRIVGAVTHVLVNDPTRGYGIFIENMLEAAK